MSAFNTKPFVAELVGTFMLVFVGAAAAIVGAGSGSLLASALAFGSVLAVLVLMYGRVSGAHFNPAVTFGMALNGTLKWGEAAFYWLAQFIGAILAGFLLNWVLTALNAGIRGAATVGVLTDLTSATAQTHSIALLIEAVMTFLLVTAYLRFVQSGAQASVGAWAIGATLAFAILAGGAFTGSSLNPARTFGITLPLAIGSKDFTTLASPFTYVVYFFGPLIGATLAVLLNNYLEGTMDEEPAEMEPLAADETPKISGE